MANHGSKFEIGGDLLRCTLFHHLVGGPSNLLFISSERGVFAR